MISRIAAAGLWTIDSFGSQSYALGESKALPLDSDDEGLMLLQRSLPEVGRIDRTRPAPFAAISLLNRSSSPLRFLERMHGGQALGGAGDATAGDAGSMEEFGPWGYDLNGMDRTSSPGKDFNQWTNGKWIEETKIPGDERKWAFSFSTLHKKVQAQIETIVKSDAHKDEPYAKFFQSWMNVEVVNKRNREPLKKYMDEIRAIKDFKGFASLFGRNVFDFGASTFALYISSDAKDPKKKILHLEQEGLSLPREYYIEDAKKETKAKFLQYIADMFVLTGWRAKDEAEEAAEAALRFETDIAKASWGKKDVRDSSKSYNKMKIDDLSNNIPNFDWPAYLEAAVGDMKVLEGRDVIVGAYSKDGAKSGIPGIADIISKASIPTLQSYCVLHLLKQAAKFLPDDIANRNFDFFGKTLNGLKDQKSREKRGVELANRVFADAIGKIYAKQQLKPKVMEQMTELTSMLKNAFEERIKKVVTWMQPQTKVKALEKLERFHFEIGEPRKFKDKAIVMIPDKLFENVCVSNKWDWDWELEQLPLPVDDSYWSMSPATVNAYFSPLFNKVVLTAAIMQPPFFNAEADFMVNLGGIGAVVGHEMTHGFDNEGRKYNADGVLSDWWTEDDVQEFKKRTDVFVAQLQSDRIPAYLNLPADINAHSGELHLAESIADNGGLNLGAYAISKRDKEDELAKPWLIEDGNPKLERLRRFYAGWAQVWREKSRPEAVEMQLVNDEHPPAFERVVDVRNLDSWYEAFDVKEGEAEYIEPAKRVSIW